MPVTQMWETHESEISLSYTVHLKLWDLVSEGRSPNGPVSSVTLSKDGMTENLPVREAGSQA